MQKLFYLLLAVSIVMAGSAYSFAEGPGASAKTSPAAEVQEAAPAIEMQDDAPAAEEQGAPPAEGQQEEAAEPEEQAPLEYLLEPKVETWLGAKVADLRGSSRAAEYSWMKSSPTGGFNVLYFPLPQRFEAHFNFIDEKNHDADFSYAWRDVFVMNYESRELWHNLDHLRFFEGAIAGVAVPFDKNPTAQYGVAVNDNRLFMRFKWPNNPYHVFVELREFDKEGDIQQRFFLPLTGFTGFNGQKTLQTRHIDWNTQLLRVGANGHFGPVEAEYVHGIKAFNASGEKALTDFYPAASGRPDGVYPHNVVPDLERSWDTLKLHTAYTGRIVGNLTLTSGHKRNRDNLAYVNYARASTSWSFIPLENLTVVARLKYDRAGDHNPQRVVEADLSTGTIARVDAVTRRSMTITKDVAEVAMTYYPLKALGIKTEYNFFHIDRRYAYDWINPSVGLFLPSDANIHTARVSAWARPFRDVSVRGNAGWVYCSDALNPEGFRSKVNGMANGNWAIRPGLNLNLNYKFNREENPFDFSGQTGGDRKRHVASDTGGANLSWTPLGWLNTTAYYSYMRTRTEAPLTFQASSPNTPVNTGRTTALVVIDSNNRDSAHVYGLTGDTAFDSPLNFSTEFHQSFSRGRFDLNSNPLIQNPISGTFYQFDFGDIPAYTDVRIRETGGSFSARYSFPKGWGASATYSIDDYQDLADKPQNGPQDGTAHTVMLIVSKKW